MSPTPRAPPPPRPRSPTSPPARAVRGRNAGEIRLPVADPSAAAEALRRLDARGLSVAAIDLQHPTLDDVFLTLTGRRADEHPTDQRPDLEAA